MGFSKLTLSFCCAVVGISVIALFASTVNADCWETNQCQLDSWRVKGCQQYGRVEQSKRACNGGHYYTCCTANSVGRHHRGGGGGHKNGKKAGNKKGKGKKGRRGGRKNNHKRNNHKRNASQKWQPPKHHGGHNNGKSNHGGYSTPVIGSSEVKYGKTTRYWDCCKPSCSWPGKAPVNAPVKTCAANGHSVISPNAGSSCNGGNAYVCNSQQPFVGKDGRAYGFAAAVITGQGEQQSCCACYELTFTNGPVNGKKMVVQVTNTGDDLGQNHFDLQIPGGGVGIFNTGCKSQWNAPEEGWGQRYGGIDAEWKCNQLPEQLRSGCKFRFGWFKNADNPSMKFVQVTCPAELVSRTGCSRK